MHFSWVVVRRGLDFSLRLRALRALFIHVTILGILADLSHRQNSEHTVCQTWTGPVGHSSKGSHIARETSRENQVVSCSLLHLVKKKIPTQMRCRLLHLCIGVATSDADQSTLGPRGTFTGGTTVKQGFGLPYAGT